MVIKFIMNNVGTQMESLLFFFTEVLVVEAALL
jgi:hypothetical protein